MGMRAVTETAKSGLAVSHLQALHDAVAKGCTAANGVIMDPRACTFDPGVLTCGPSETGDACLSPEQIIAVRKIYDGPRTSSGARIWPGFARGSERLWEQFFINVSADGARGGGSGFGIYRFMVFADPTWTLPRMDFDRDVTTAQKRIGGHLDPDNPDLRSFARRGGKLIVYHGWADQQVPSETSLAYRKAMLERIPEATVNRFFRLFMTPGMSHCAAAPPGPNFVLQPAGDPAIAPTAERDILTALERWVENGQAPSHFVVRLQDESRALTPRTVLACAEPHAARYSGAGDPLDAANWRCER